MADVLRTLGSVSVDRFMREYWQKRPVLLRGALDPWACPLAPADLMELACRDDADARLILTAEDPPEIHHGPFEPEDFEDLPDEAWTVLVQEVDRLHPGVAALLERFRFLPNWRLDDVMISYALPGGGVGAHIDQYDVFLIQGSGRRRWEIETQAVANPVWRADSEVAILAAFDPDASWVLEPGDVLYLPPGVPHNGVALDPCLTLSVGCRAPDTSELLAGIAALAAESVGDTPRYADPDLAPQDDPGRLPDEALEALRSRIREALADDRTLDRWLGRFVTEPVRGWSGTPPARRIGAARIQSRLRAGERLRAAVVSQMSYVAHADGSTTVFSSGQVFDLPPGAADVARLLTGPYPIGAEALADRMADERVASVVADLVHLGALVFGAD